MHGTVNNGTLTSNYEITIIPLVARRECVVCYRGNQLAISQARENSKRFPISMKYGMHKNELSME